MSNILLPDIPVHYSALHYFSTNSVNFQGFPSIAAAGLNRVWSFALQKSDVLDLRCFLAFYNFAQDLEFILIFCSNLI